MESERVSLLRPRIRSLAAMGTLAALSLHMSCGGKTLLDNGGHAVAGGSGIDEPHIAATAGQGRATAGSGALADPGAGASGEAGTSVDGATAVAGAGGRSICASRTTESPARRLAFEFVVEASESMKQPALGSTLTRWEVVKDALAGFAQWVPPTVAVGTAR